MKTLLVCALMALAVVPGRAQLFTPESLGGAALGGLAGGIIGHNHHRQTAEGAAIGAGAGLLLGSLFHHSRRHDTDYRDYRDRRPHPYHPSRSDYGYSSYHYTPALRYRPAPPSEKPAPVTIININNYYQSNDSMNRANRLFGR